MHYVSQKLIYPELFSKAVSKGSSLHPAGKLYWGGGCLASLWLCLLIPNTTGPRIRVWVKKSGQKPTFPDSHFPWQGQDGWISQNQVHLSWLPSPQTQWLLHSSHPLGEGCGRSRTELWLLARVVVSDITCASDVALGKSSSHINSPSLNFLICKKNIITSTLSGQSQD